LILIDSLIQRILSLQCTGQFDRGRDSSKRLFRYHSRHSTPWFSRLVLERCRKRSKRHRFCQRMAVGSPRRSEVRWQLSTSRVPEQMNESLTSYSWNKNLARQRAKYMGSEAKIKGVNALLGPAIGPIGRVVRGGRNWEGIKLARERHETHLAYLLFS
jgi:hypothetical protein